MKWLVLTDAAEADLDAVADRIAVDSPRRAETFVNEPRESCLKLTEMLLRFSLVPRYAKVGVRRRVHRNYLIFYPVSDRFVQVLRVVHGAVDLEHLIMPDA